MKIGVCVKVTPDTDTRVKIAGEGIDTDGIKWIVSPYDAFAIEEGVKTKEKLTGEVVLYTVGDDTTQAQIRGSGLSVGADRAVQIDDPALKGTDSLGVAKALAAAIKADGIELVFCGKQAIDDDNVQVPAMVAELLGWPHVSMAVEFSVEGNAFRAARNIGGGVVEVVSGSLPAVITADRGLNAPRYAKLPDIMKAKTKPLAKKNLAALGLSAGDVAPAVTLTAWGLPAGRAKGRILKGDTDTVVKELVKLLREEAKVI